VVAVVIAMRWRGRRVVGGDGYNREAALWSRWQLCRQQLKVLVGGGGDDVVDGGGLSSLPQKPGAKKKTADRFGKVGTQVCIKQQEANL